LIKFNQVKKKLVKSLKIW